MSLQEVQSVSGGILAGGDAVFDSVSIDTRTLQANDLFVAIKGPNFNGNEYVGVAAKKNACAAIVSEKTGTEAVDGFATLLVDDTRKVLGRIGKVNRERSKACLVAMTGSQGKTTVREMTVSILAQCGEVIMTRGNLNNELGVPLSLITIEEQHEYAVIELAANGPGEIAYTVDLARPNIAHITNIAGTHLEGFGDLDGVARAKSEIWQGIRDGGTAVVNLDDAFAGQFIKQINAQAMDRVLLTVSGNGNSEADYWAGNVRLRDYRAASFTLNSPAGAIDVTLQVAGKHNVSNALAAAAMAMAAGAGLENVKAGLEQFSSVKGRMCILHGVNKSTVIDDSYNASPSSFRAAIDVLAATQGTTVVVMGDMGELGSEEVSGHREIGKYAREQGVNHFIAVGELSRHAVEAFGEGAILLEARDDFASLIIPLLNESVTVLVKGSRSQGMEKLVKQIQAGD